MITAKSLLELGLSGVGITHTTASGYTCYSYACYEDTALPYARNSVRTDLQQISNQLGTLSQPKHKGLKPLVVMN